MSWMRIIHVTEYRYKNPLSFAPHRLVLRPREGHDIRVEEMLLSIEPEFALEWSRDVFGNSVATVHFLKESDFLHITNQVTLRQTDPFPLPAVRTAVPAPFPVYYSPEESVVAAAYKESIYPTDVAAVRNWLEQNVDISSCSDAEGVVELVNLTLKQTIAYARRETRGVQTPMETLKVQQGSCRDVATLFLEALRILGFPARFVSGYLDCQASEMGRASMHAWAEAYLPETGWVGYDPTVGAKTSSRHVVVGVSNHPRGVMPVTGSYYGTRGQFLEMNVTVKTERLTEQPAPLDPVS